MKRVLIGLTLLTLIYCSEKEESNISEMEKPEENLETDSTAQETYSFLALGDSYTIGQSVAEDQRWPVQLAEKLNELGIGIDEPRIIARTGWTTDELKAAIKEENISEKYDLVSLLIGVNNQYRGYPIAQQEKEFEELLIKAIEFAGNDTSRVFIVSIPDYGVTPFANGSDQQKIATEIDQYNEINKSIAAKHKITYFDITPISREAKEKQSLIASDGLHPSGEMYAQWVDLILPWAEEELQP